MTASHSLRRLRPLMALAGSSLLAGCVATTSSNTQNPDGGGEFNDYYSENGDPGGTNAGDGGGGTTADSGRKPRVRDVTGTRGLDKSVLAKKLRAKKPPRDPGADPDPGGGDGGGDAGEDLTYEGFAPSMAGPGSAVEIFGAGLTKKTKVTVGGKSWRVVQASGDRLVAQVPRGAKSGKVVLGKDAAESGGEFTALTDDGGFGKRRTRAGQGLWGLVFALPAGATELPDFGQLGDAVGLITVDNLDIPNKPVKAKLPGGLTTFAVHFQGSINVVKGGDYNFCLNSDDGAQLYLEQNLVVDNDGAHEAKEQCEGVFLDPGEYKVDMLYFQGDSPNAALRWTWQRDGGRKEAVPVDVLFPPEGFRDMAFR